MTPCKSGGSPLARDIMVLGIGVRVELVVLGIGFGVELIYSLMSIIKLQKLIHSKDF